MAMPPEAIELEDRMELERVIRDFITQAEACNFTDRHGHALEMNAAYRALKDSVSE